MQRNSVKTKQPVVYFSERGTLKVSQKRALRALAHANLFKDKHPGMGGRPEGPSFLEWCRNWAETKEGQLHLLKFAYHPDPWLAFQATLAIYAYAYGRPGEMSRPQQEGDAKGVAIDWRQYEGQEGKDRLVADIKAELTRAGFSPESTSSAGDAGTAA